MTEREYRRVKLAGVSKRQAGRPITDNPYAGKPSLRRHADAWAAGWQSEDYRRRA